MVAAAAMLCCGWGGNQFTPLLVVYRHLSGYSATVTDALLGTYVLGLIPGLLIGGPLSDRYGRRPLMIAATALSALASTVLAFGSLGLGPLVAGRLITGAAVGVAMAVGSSWVKELSAPPFDTAAASGDRDGGGRGARRGALALTLGFGLGAGVAGVLAQWAPAPRVLPYVAHMVITLPVLALVVRRGVETRRDVATGSAGATDLTRRLRVPAAGHRRFLWVVVPMAPWIFGSAGVAYAVIPEINAPRLGQWGLLYATGLTVATLGTGAAVQPLARRLDTISSARAVVVSLMLMSVGMGAAALDAGTGSAWFGLVAAMVLGAAYGIAIVSGLLEVQRIAEAAALAGRTGGG
jgi:MFS family permease